MNIYANERWKKVETAPHFNIEISNIGRVKSNGKICNGTPLKGYWAIKLSTTVNGKRFFYYSMIHILVAQYFCNIPQGKKYIAHIDYDKTNNRAINLKGMDRDELTEHTKKAPKTIQNMELRRMGAKPICNSQKLTTTKVMLLKKLLAEGKPIPYLRKIFKISDTQINRIKIGENWKDVPAAK